MTSSTPIPVVSRFRCFADSQAMFRNPVQVLSRYNKIFGDTFRLYLGGLKEAIVTIDPAVIQHVLKTNSENYQKSDIQVKRMGHFLGKGLLTTHGEAWRTQRRLIQKGFDRTQLDALSAIMQDSLAESLRDFDKQARRYLPPADENYLRDGRPIAVWRELEGRRHRSGQPDHLHRSGIHCSANSSALSQSLVRRFGGTAQARRHAHPRGRHSARIHQEAPQRTARPRL